VVDDIDAAFKDADIVYAKSWGAMVHTPDADEGARIIKKYESWITDERRMKLANRMPFICTRCLLTATLR